MPESQKPQIGLPLPKWCFVLLGIPTFYMPWAYLAVVVWAFAGMLAGGEFGELPQWLAFALEPAGYVTLGTCLIYIAWVGLSKRLAMREKGLWLAIVVLFNMVGMPLFYVFMIRRYLGLEGRTGKRDEAALDRFLIKHALRRDQMSSAQLDVLRFYCRQYRLTKWAVVPGIAVAALVLYVGVFYLPKSCMQIFVDFTPTHVVITDAATGSKQEIVPDPETVKQHVQIVMMVGATAGMMGAMSFFMLTVTLSSLWGNGRRKAFIEFLKASDPRDGVAAPESTIKLDRKSPTNGAAQCPGNAVSLICTDRWRSLEFYRDVFGAELMSDDTPITCPWMQLGNLTITLVPNTERESPFDFSEHAMATLLLQVDDLHAAFDRAMAHGARVIQPPDEHGTTFIVADPDGIFIEAMQFRAD